MEEDKDLLPVAEEDKRVGAGGGDDGGGGGMDRPLNVTDALSYLDAVKNKFNDQPDVYNHFLDIMKEFKNEQIDTPGVIQRVSQLFHGHPLLIQGFNTFLPVGYRIECSSDSQDGGELITVTTPAGTTTQSTNGLARGGAASLQATLSSSARYDAENGHENVIPSSPDARLYTMDGQAIEPAVQYVQKIKQRCDLETYRQFLDILSKFHYSPDSIDEDEVSRQVARLFKDAPDLRDDFRVFLPDRGQKILEDVSTSSRSKDRRKADASAINTAASLPQKRKRRATEKEKEREKEQALAKNLPPTKKMKHALVQDSTPMGYNPKHVVAAPSSPRRGGVHHHQQHHHHHPIPVQSARSLMNDDAHFFDRVKLFMTDRDIYNEFLKLVNLFAQDFIDTPRLVKESRNFLGNTDLYRQFLNILGWDEKKEMEHYQNEQATSSGWSKPVVAALPVRPGRVDMAEKYGSYRRVSTNEASVPCSGRDEMCRSVLNDEWVSHPTWTSDDLPYVAHKKNVYEEALHRSEEERHEYDFHIEAISRTIMTLEPINNKISQMGPEDRATYKLKPNLGGSWKAVHQRVIKKIYGREAGMDVIKSLQETPVLAVPVVLQRLKQKEEEWKRAQREWNKVWREVDARNYTKSLDHQAISFKLTDKRAITTKALLNQIETAREEQMAKRACLIDPLFARTRARYQLEFTIDNEECCLHDSIKLVLSFLDRTQGQLNVVERKRIESFLRTFVPLFFCLDPVEFNSAFVVHEIVESENSDVEGGGGGMHEEHEPVLNTSNSRGRNNGGGGGGGGGRGHHSHTKNVSSGGDLRKKLLKSEQAKLTSSRKTRAQEAAAAATASAAVTPAVSRFASPVPPPPVVVVVVEEDKEKEKEKVVEVGSSTSTSSQQQQQHHHHKRLSTTTMTKLANVFFTNTTFYVLLRLIEILYTRLSSFKAISAQLVSGQEVYTPIIPGERVPGPLLPLPATAAKASSSSSSSSPPPPSPSSSSSALPRNVNYYYEMLLGLCERLFENEIEPHLFEDQIREVFRLKHAYKIFTVDKVIGAIIKQVQAVIADPRSQDLLELLKRERSIASPPTTTQDRINGRRQAETVLGPDENVFRIDWLSGSKTMTIQLIGKDDSSFEDSEVLTGRWQAYIDSYVSEGNTEEVAQNRIKRPFLRRNLPESIRTTPLKTASHDGLEIKLCVRTYRLFYVSHTEDFIWKYRSKEEFERYTRVMMNRLRLNASRNEWFSDEKKQDGTT